MSSPESPVAAVDWRELRERRVAFAIATVAAPIVALILAAEWGAIGVLPAFVVWCAAFAWLWTFRCPKCGKSFVGARLAVFASFCGNCGTAEFGYRRPLGPALADSPDMAGLAPLPRQGLSNGLRRFIAGSEFVSGIVVLVTGTLAGASVANGVWQRWSLLGFGVIAIVGGFALYRNEDYGYGLTRILLAAQVLGLLVPGIALQVIAGPFVGITVGSGGFDLSFGWYSKFVFWIGQTTGWTVSINIFAIAILLLLSQSQSPREHRI